MRWTVAVALLLISTVAFAQSTRPAKRSDMDGVWILVRSSTETPRLTPEGERKRAAYDFQKDDPDMRCIPVSFTRVMHTPSPPIEVRQRKDTVEINYEFMDVKRRVPLKAGLLVKDAPYAVSKHPHMGRSVGKYEGETLVIETAGQRAGVLDTLGVPGLYQSDQIRTVERWVPNGDRMDVTITHNDPVYFVQPLIVHYSYLRLPGGKILKWDCKPEEATYERFLNK
jgi:hypothetical protein